MQANPAELVRADNWWASKLPPLIGLALAQALLDDLPFPRAAVLTVAVILLSGGAVGAYGHVINDIFDLEADRLSGKHNRMAGLAPPLRVLLAAGLIGIVFVPAFLLDYGRTAVVLLVVVCLLPTVYSVPPLRLKDRGFLGVLADAGGAHVVPALIVVAALAGEHALERPLWLVVVALWTTTLGLEGILWHQLMDREDDLAAGVRTWATGVDPSRLRAVLVTIVHPAQVLVFVALIVLVAPRAPILVAAFVVFLLIEIIKTVLGWDYVYAEGSDLLRRRHLPLVSNFFYELWLPVALGLQLAMVDPRFLALVALVVVVFRGNVKAQAADLVALATDLNRRLVRPRVSPPPPVIEPVEEPPEQPRFSSWRLETHDSAAAELIPGGRAATVRLDITSAGNVSWQVKLVRDPAPLSRGTNYSCRCELRSEHSRSLTVCVVRAEEPWDNLGLSEEIEIGPEWQSVAFSFVANDDAEALFSLLFGGSAIAVEVGDVMQMLERGVEAAQ